MPRHTLEELLSQGQAPFNQSALGAGLSGAARAGGELARTAGGLVAAPVLGPINAVQRAREGLDLLTEPRFASTAPPINREAARTFLLDRIESQRIGGQDIARSELLDAALSERAAAQTGFLSEAETERNQARTGLLDQSVGRPPGGPLTNPQPARTPTLAEDIAAESPGRTSLLFDQGGGFSEVNRLTGFTPDTPLGRATNIVEGFNQRVAARLRSENQAKRNQEQHKRNLVDQQQLEQFRRPGQTKESFKRQVDKIAREEREDIIRGEERKFRQTQASEERSLQERLANIEGAKELGVAGIDAWKGIQIADKELEGTIENAASQRDVGKFDRDAQVAVGKLNLKGVQLTAMATELKARAIFSQAYVDSTTNAIQQESLRKRMQVLADEWEDARGDVKKQQEALTRFDFDAFMGGASDIGQFRKDVGSGLGT